jgi:glycosyltransferase involved in cell wall biosynthesis
MTTCTFAILTYNQSSYIKQSMQSVFDQDCSVDQIIISDDCSTDNTYQIIQELASSYEGSGNLIVRRNKTNLGTIKHLNKIVNLATGEIIIFLAGDDVSAPSRARIILNVYNETKPLLIHSDVYCISSYGEPLDSPFGKSICPTLWDDAVELEPVAQSMALYIGATLAVSKELFKYFGPIHYTDAYEDLVLGYRAKLLGKIKFIPHELVGYRLGVGVSWGDQKLLQVQQAVLMQRFRDTQKCHSSKMPLQKTLWQLQRQLFKSTVTIMRMENPVDLWDYKIPNELHWIYRSQVLAYKVGRLINAIAARLKFALSRMLAPLVNFLK